MVKVAVLGAAGGIGQPLSLLIKNNPLVTELALFDIVNTPGVAADLSHINTPAVVKGYVGDDQIQEALTGCHIVVIPGSSSLTLAGVPRKPGMTRDDLFNINAGIVRNLAGHCAKYCPKAFLAVISNPVNSTVPIVAEVFKKAGVYDPKRIFGVTTLDITRANTFVSQLKNTSPLETNVTVIGGHSGATIIPVLSTLNHTFSDSERDTLVNRIQFGGDEVVKAKNGAGSATLSMAFAGAKFVSSLLSASVAKKTGVRECTFINTDVVPGLEFFSTIVELGPSGVEKVHPIPKLSEYEQGLYNAAVPELKNSIQKGIEFVAKASLVLEDIVEQYKHISSEVAKSIEVGVQTEETGLQGVQEFEKKRGRYSDEGPNKRLKKLAVDEIITCPICYNLVYYSKLNHHMDLSCSKESTVRGAESDGSGHTITSKSLSNEFKHKPSVPYGFHKDDKIRKLLRDDGLSTHGNRQALIKRHSNWILAFNANCDLKYPRPVHDIRKEFLKSEEQTPAAPVFTSNAKHELTPIEHMQIQSHAEKYKEEFDMLIQQVKERKQRKMSESKNSQEAGKENDSSMVKEANSTPVAIEIE
ncbi:Malate dehydrogenase, cytoplasmic [Terramyces sp. JEL0728]|nr:Malate dehydrogenase, cytoplasmic [Terramyces sp. JEL0728]